MEICDFMRKSNILIIGIEDEKEFQGNVIEWFFNKVNFRRRVPDSKKRYIQIWRESE